MTEQPIAALGERLDGLLDQVAHLDEPVRSLVEQVVEASEDFTRAGLVTLVQALRADPAAEQVLLAALESPEVMAVLVRHRIVRGGRPLEVLRVLEALRPYLVASGADVEVVELDEERAVLRLTGSRDTALSDQVRDSLLSRVPGLVEVVWAPAASPAFVPVEDLLRRP